jgi:hypothetical protein
MTVYSTKEQLIAIATYLSAYMRIPYFQDDTIPGQVMEKIVSLVHNKAIQLKTYDYVDVYLPENVGWQVKSTKCSTPITWKRAKIANSNKIIAESDNDQAVCKRLGDLIIDFCNNHAKESLSKYLLQEIGFSRLILFDDRTAIYYERLLIDRINNINIFDKNNYDWHWSVPKIASKKEQLQALHGTDNTTGKKAFAWHGRGENQLHFSGERDWWPEVVKPSIVGQINFSEDCHAIAFKLPPDKLPWKKIVGFLASES